MLRWIGDVGRKSSILTATDGGVFVKFLEQPVVNLTFGVAVCCYMSDESGVVGVGGGWCTIKVPYQESGVFGVC